MKKHTPQPTETAAEKASRDNRSRQLNSENEAYWKSRGESGRPQDGQTSPPPPSPSTKST